MNKQKTAILLMNVGSPDKPSLWTVFRYLSKFLNDEYVIDLPWLMRKILVNLVIIPFRVSKSTRLYKKVWTEDGSPLIYHSNQMRDHLQAILDQNYKVFLGMRYGNPGYKAAIKKIKQEKFERLIVFTLFPQYAMSTTGTAVKAVLKESARQMTGIKPLIISQFYNHPQFINAFATQAEQYDTNSYDHIVFSYHGLPIRQIEKCHPEIKVGDCNCLYSMPGHGHNCYRATCYATTRLLAEKMKLNPDKYTTAFQSRLSKNWLEPFTDKVLLSKLKEGNIRILVIAPSFVTDCLETLYEIKQEYGKIFGEAGGEKLQLVESLNSNQIWVIAMKKIIMDNTP